MHAYIVASQYSSLTRQQRPERTHSHSHTETWCNITKIASLWCIFWRVVIVVHFFTSSRISSSAANREWINWEPPEKNETLLFARSEYQLRAVAFNYVWWLDLDAFVFMYVSACHYFKKTYSHFSMLHKHTHKKPEISAACLLKFLLQSSQICLRLRTTSCNSRKNRKTMLIRNAFRIS